MNQQGDQTQNIQAIVLAAGRGSRMGTAVPKVLIPLLGKPVLQYVLDTLSEAGVEQTTIVVSPSTAEPIREAVGDSYVYALQGEQLGSGHAVQSARGAAGDARTLLIMCGDSPLFTSNTVRSLLQALVEEDAVVALTSAVLADPRGYGRIVRSTCDEVIGIAEEKNATDEQKTIREINGGAYAFDASWMWQNINLLSKNEAGEYCLTEMVDIAISQGKRVVTVPCSAEEVAGINTPDQLAEAERILNLRSDQDS